MRRLDSKYREEDIADEAETERPTGDHKKTRHMAGLSVFLVAGA